ncbi:MAG: hypothetical protein PWP27_714 [Clostridiales bacterium]|nr:hypothetical protein [Clostridiales bacterium]MDK2932904.1 hypothetical protein [Clostridiales bacterium]
MEKHLKAKVKEVRKGSIADEAGIVPGDIIIKINGEKFDDILEYKFITSEQELELEIVKGNGDIEIVTIYNEDYEDLGIIFENPLIDTAKCCSNKCIFCFIDQLPKNMRKTLYFKDDDSRLSFLQGNYITLTNMSDTDLDRIIKLRLSPINISVHTTNVALRIKMLGNENAGKIMGQMKKLAQAQIVMNCQIVLCRNVNDGSELDKTLHDLTSLYPYVNSISVVPVGLTAYRENLFDLKPYTKDASLAVIHQVGNWQKKLLKKYGSRIVFLADEFYILGEKTIPPYSHYEGFPQIENGVGLIASMQQEFNEEIEKISKNDFLQIKNKSVSIATGVSAKLFIYSLCNKLQSKAPGLDIKVYAIKNKFFGENVTVAGLVTGQDIINQLKGKDLGTELLIPVIMLRKDRDIFLDDLSIGDVERELGIKVTVVENNGFDFIDKVLGVNNIDSWRYNNV